MTQVASTSSTGPGGPHFEGQVGASYLLALLVGAEPRGLPGTTIDRVEFQRAAEGHPLDDVIVHAHDALGKPAILEIQVKKGMTFAHGDKIFREVIGQIVDASHKTEFENSRYELGIAISRTSHNIDGPYQDVLTWAKQIGDSVTFINRINRPGSANERMRSFVETFRAHLKEACAPHDDEAVWRLLRRMHILVFDFTSPGSASEDLAKERAARALHPEDTARAGNLWDELVELSIEIAKSGGDRKREELKAELAQKGFRLAADRHNLPALAALAEASRNTLTDIEDRLAGVMLTRHEQVASVHDALDRGRYVEIRGDAGVGKSVVLRHFAEQASAEGRIVALSPGRTVGKGWTVMRSVLNFDGTARELLSDLATSGGAFLFIDSLDFLGEDERRTVTDLVREAANVPGISVIATARRDFGIGEPNWLPSEALDALGRTEPVVIGELSDSETEELRSAAPELTALLSDSHPARPVARNLFRLSRLSRRPSDVPVPRTEVEMAEEWWQSADGNRDQGHRERSRVLVALAEQALSRIEQLSVKNLPAAAVDALVASESLRDLGNDRVMFRHDVLREWAIANLLFADPALVASLPLDRPAQADLARGVELAARIAIERTANGDAWHQFLIALSKEGINGSWRRAALLALVRSEAAGEMLTKASTYLLADHGKLLAEVIRIVMAVDSEPATKYYAGVGLDPRSIPAGINIPSGPTWLRLIIWLLKLGSGLPARVIPDVVALYTDWSVVLGGRDAYTPHIVRWFYRWLTEIMKPSNGETPRRPFNGEFAGQVGRLAEDLRTGFLLFCNHAPDLAVAFLKSLNEHPYADRAREEILKFRGALAQAAPTALAELTAEVLIPKRGNEDKYRHSPFPEPFGHTNLSFVPASPAQGPFLELLVHAPEYGLPLIRKLVDHAVNFHTGGRDFGENAMRIASPDGSKVVFPWHRTYGWSRDLGSGPAVLASALMALEAWSHMRIEAGEPIDRVVADVIGAANPPAAYLLVIVDLLLSHWPESNVAAISFLACPELLCLDRQRASADDIEFPDIFGIKALLKEPRGLASIESMKARPSRRFALDRLLGYYAQEEFKEQRAILAGLLHLAAERLGPPKPESDLGDPKFMVVHALNQINPDNWRITVVQGKDGPMERWEYVSPTAESKHLKPLQESTRERLANGQMRQAISIALNDPARSSQGFAAAAVKWAQEVKDKPTENETEQWTRKEAIVTAATIAARDGSPEFIAENAEWIRKTFDQAFKGRTDPVHRTRAGLQYNPIAIAFAGTVLLLRNGFAMEDVRTLLEAAGGDNPAAAQGFVYVAAAMAAIDERLPRAILRCAFSACVHPYKERAWLEEEDPSLDEDYRRQVSVAIDAELRWLAGERKEPEWPLLAPRHASPRYGSSHVREEGVQVLSQRTDVQAAGLWLGNAATLFDVAQRPWLRDVAKAYSEWTFIANGSELAESEEPDNAPNEWNQAYFKLLAHCLPGLARAEIDEIALKPIVELPERSFLRTMAIFLREADAVYFNERTLDSAEAVYIRMTLAERLMKTRAWDWECCRRSNSISLYLGPATATVFFNDDEGWSKPPQCYLHAPAIERVQPFAPVLQKVVESGFFIYPAMVLLNLLEVAPSVMHLPLILAAARVWRMANPDKKEFWVDLSVGRRLCALIDSIRVADPAVISAGQAARGEIEGLLASLIALGIPEAHHLEEALRKNE